MKRISVKLFAVVAVLAVAMSAFTTQKAKISFTGESWYLSQSGITAFPALGDAYNSTTYIVKHGLVPPTVTTNECGITSTELCAAYFKLNVSNNPVVTTDPDESGNPFVIAGGRQ